MWPLVGVAAFLAGGCRPATATSSRPRAWSAAEFESVKPRAMQALDENVADLGAAASAMEKELGAFVERALAADDAGRLTTEAERESAGLALIYGAMYVLHDAHLVDQGKIAAARLYGAQADAAAVRAEGTARRHRAGELFVRAQRLRPNDGRIASWIAAAGAHEHSLPGGEIDDADKGKLFTAIEVDPLFNLFTALIVLRREPIDSPRGRALFKRTQAFLQARMCKDLVPGTKQARYCTDTPLAPGNEEAATVILADLYARNGEDALRRGDVPNAMPALATAKSLLAVLEDDAHREAGARWKYRPLVDARRKRLAALAPGQHVPDAAFWSSAAYEGMYTCATCHAK
ncbi:MAG TPA: hypothetical protein VFF06_36630 [Polyangia bacterium]|nr:hypothetical protein [Polyangia bacterium]